MDLSASGKVILLGEHAVVYGHPALAGALAAGARVSLRRGGRGVLEVPAWNARFLPDDAADQRPVAQAYRALRRALGVGDSSPADLVLELGVPTGAGLGSSAAMAVAVARALAFAHDLPSSDPRLAEAAAASETVIHGRPSGLDQAFAQAGGFGLFTRARGLERVQARKPLALCVGHTGRERDTKGRVARVAELHATDPAGVGARFQAIAELVARGRAAVEVGDLAALGAAMDENQRHLEALEVSSPEIERLCALAHEAGALGAKLTGGGGGGCVIAVAEQPQAVAEAWERAGYRAFVVTVGGEARGGAA